MSDVNHALALVVQLGGGSKCRRSVAGVLRTFRLRGRADAARRFREHVVWITGHLWKD